jgi:hypothetical protein
MDDRNLVGCQPADVAADAVHMQAVTLGNQAVGGDGALAGAQHNLACQPLLSGLSNLPIKPIQITSNLVAFQGIRSGRKLL